MPVYAVGDVQGCYDSLMRLLEKIEFDESRDRLWFVGDLVNRGPKSLAALRFVKGLGDRAITVLGNHDLNLLALVHGHRALKSSDTVHDVLKAPDRDALIDWLRRRPLMHVDVSAGFAMAHAGVPHLWNLEFALARAREVEAALVREDYAALLGGMYGNNPACWNDELTGTERFRTIINYFTRMRLLDPVGGLELTFDGPVAAIPRGFKAWFEYYRSVPPQLPLVFGHWAALNGDCGVERLYALDTGCVWGNRLTALRLADRERFSVQSVEVK
jgi:bis(5'-nucleosyl)-tetraphosphatase (symmetrical)